MLPVAREQLIRMLGEKDEQIAVLRKGLSLKALEGKLRSEQPTPEGATLVEAWEYKGQIIVMGFPDGGDDHSCDQMGCCSIGNHVVARIDLLRQASHE